MHTASSLELVSAQPGLLLLQVNYSPGNVGATLANLLPVRVLAKVRHAGDTLQAMHSIMLALALQSSLMLPVSCACLSALFRPSPVQALQLQA